MLLLPLYHIILVPKCRHECHKTELLEFVHQGVSQSLDAILHSIHLLTGISIPHVAMRT